MTDVFFSADITVSAGVFAHRHRLKSCHSIICICSNSLSRAAHACLFGGLGAVVSRVMPKHWGRFYEVMENAVHDTAPTTAHYQTCRHRQEIQEFCRLAILGPDV